MITAAIAIKTNNENQNETTKIMITSEFFDSDNRNDDYIGYIMPTK